MITKKIILLILFLFVSVYGQNKKVNTYPQDFSPQALKNLRAEMGDSANTTPDEISIKKETGVLKFKDSYSDSLMIVNNITQLKAFVRHKAPVYMAGPSGGIFVHRESTENFTEDSVLIFKDSNNDFRVRRSWLESNRKILYSHWGEIPGEHDSTTAKRLISLVQPYNPNDRNVVEHWERGQGIVVTATGDSVVSWTGLKGTVLNDTSGAVRLDVDTLEFITADQSYLKMDANDNNFNPLKTSFSVDVEIKWTAAPTTYEGIFSKKRTRITAYNSWRN